MLTIYADPQITGMHDTMFFVAMIWKKNIGLRSEFGRQLKKDNKPPGSAGGSVREWKFLKYLSFLRSVIVPRNTVDNLAKPEETQVQMCRVY